MQRGKRKLIDVWEYGGEQSDAYAGETVMPDLDCPRHAGAANDRRRQPQDAVMRDLPNNQSGDGRHKCPYCAYERGASDYRQRVAEFLARLPDELPDLP